MKELSKILWFIEVQPGEDYNLRTSIAAFDDEKDARAALKMLWDDKDLFYAVTLYTEDDGELVPWDEYPDPPEGVDEPLWFGVENSMSADGETGSSYYYLSRADAEVIVDAVLSGEEHDEHGNGIWLKDGQIFVSGESLPLLIVLVAHERGYRVQQESTE